MSKEIIYWIIDSCQAIFLLTSSCAFNAVDIFLVYRVYCFIKYKNLIYFFDLLTTGKKSIRCHRCIVSQCLETVAIFVKISYIMKTSFSAFIFCKYEKSHLWLLLCNNESRRNSSSSSSNIIVQNRLSSAWRLVYSIILCFCFQSDFFPFQSNYFENCANPKLIMEQIYIYIYQLYIHTMGEIIINGL